MQPTCTSPRVSIRRSSCSSPSCRQHRSTKMGKRIAVVGVGALGGYVGGWLAHTGEDVTLIDFWPENIEAIRSRGLELDGVTPEEKITVKNAKTMHLTEMEALSRQKPIDIAF